MFESNSGLHAPAFPRWLGDIGGTNARFGWQAQPQAPISHVQVLPCAEHPTLVDAARSYLRAQGLTAPACAAFGIATAVLGDTVTPMSTAEAAVAAAAVIVVTNPDRSFAALAPQAFAGKAVVDCWRILPEAVAELADVVHLGRG